LTPVPATCTRRSCGDPRALICEFGCTVKIPATSSKLGAATNTALPSFAVTLQKTYLPPSSLRMPPLIVTLPYVPSVSDMPSVTTTELRGVALRERIRQLADGGRLEVRDQRRLRLADLLARHGPAPFF